MSVFDQPFLFLRTPGGNVEDLDRMQAAGFRGVFCNVREHEAAEWEVVRRKALARGMFCGPWAHTMNAARAFSFDVLDKIIETADRWRSPLIVNSEKELDNSGSTLTRVIAERVGGRDAAISMQAFLFFSVEWTPVKHLPMLLQIFPAESIAAKDPLGCRERAWNAGCERVYLTFGSYREQHPGLYRLQEPYSVYTGDDCGNDYQAWSPTSSGYQATRQVTPNPPPRPPEPPPLPVVTVPLPRPVRLRVPYMTGIDVTAHKRAVYRYLEATYAWKKFSRSNWLVRRTYGPSFNVLVDNARRKAGLREGGGIDSVMYGKLRRVNAYDAYGDVLLARYAEAHPILTPRDKWRAEVTRFCLQAEANQVAWHYTQMRPFKVDVNPSGGFITSDCSAYVVQVYYAASKRSGLNVADPAKQNYSGYGNNDLYENDHPRVWDDRYLVGDLGHYPGHVTICRRAGNAQTSVWSSNGSEAGPLPVSLRYRSDFLYVVRPPLP